MAKVFATLGLPHAEEICFEFPPINWRFCIRIEFRFVNQDNFHVRVFVSVIKNFWERGEICVSNSDSMVLRNVRVCICVLNSYFRSQTKECVCIFSVGMVSRAEKLGVCFAPPSMRNRRSQFSAISLRFPLILVDFQSISTDCCHFQSVSVSFNQLQSSLISIKQYQPVRIGQNRRNLLTTYEITQKTWRKGKRTLEKIQESSGDGTPHCRFLSLVVVECVLKNTHVWKTNLVPGECDAV